MDERGHFQCADVVWVVEKGDSCDPFNKMMLEELQRRCYSEITTHKYLQYVTAFARQFRRWCTIDCDCL